MTENTAPGNSNATDWKEFAALLGQEPPDMPAIKLRLDALSQTETALLISRLEEENRSKLLELLDPADGAVLLGGITPEQASNILEEVNPEKAAAIVDELPSDEKADLLGDLPLQDAEAILGEMTPQQASQLRQLLAYPPDSAGGIMITEFLSYPDTMTVGEVIDDLRRNQSKYSDYEVQYGYLTAEDGSLSGVLQMRDLLLRPAQTPLRKIMIRQPFSVPASATLDELVQIFEGKQFLGVPVTDAERRLIGVLRKAAVHEAAEDRQKSIFLKVSGIVGGEELRAMPMLLRSMRRLSWLVPNILLNFIAASVIAMHQETLQAAIALAVFLPIVSDMSGCSGNQAVAVSIRELALGLVRPTEVIRVLFKEGGLGLINGLILGLLLGTAAYVWKGSLVLSLVVGVALAANTLLSVLLGGLVPLLLKRLRVDPALASGPILTTVTDMCGFFLILSLAGLVINRLSLL